MSATTRSGRWVRAELAADGIDLTGLAIDPAGTARMRQPDGRRTVPGSTSTTAAGTGASTVDPAVAGEIFAGSRLAMFHLPDWARHLLPVARRAGAVIACDLQDVRDPDDEYLRDFIERRRHPVRLLDHHLNPAPMLKQLVRRSDGSMVVCGRGGLGVADRHHRGHQGVPAAARRSAGRGHQRRR